MNPFEQMELMRPSFTKTDEKVFEKVTADVDAVMRFSSTELAEHYAISQAAITRFCKKLGFMGYADFKASLYQAKKSETLGASPTTAVDSYTTLLQRVPGALDQSDLPSLVGLLSGARQVITTGYHKSSLPAQLLAINLNQLRMLAHYEPFDVLTGGGYTFSADDVIVIFSVENSGYRPFVDNISQAHADAKPRVVLVTMSSRHPLRNKVDQVVWLPNWKNQNLAHYAENLVTYTVFCDLLTSALANARQA